MSLLFVLAINVMVDPGLKHKSGSCYLMTLECVESGRSCFLSVALLRLVPDFEPRAPVNWDVGVAILTTEMQYLFLIALLTPPHPAHLGAPLGLKGSSRLSLLIAAV